VNPAILTAILDALTRHFGASVPVEVAAKIIAHAPQLLGIGVDLLDGDGHLSAAHLNDIDELILDARAGRL
jgi:hypothetical protein